MVPTTTNAAVPGNVNQPSSIDLSQRWVPRLDKVWAWKGVTAPLINRNEALQVSDFNGVRSVLIRDIETLELEPYNRGGAYRFPNAQDVNSETQTFTLTQTAAWNANFDKLNTMDTQGFLTPGRWIAEQVRTRLVPSYDKHILATMSAFASVNGYVQANKDLSTQANADMVYHEIIDMCANIENRGIMVEEGRWWLIVTPSIKAALQKDNRFVRDNYVSQMQQIYKGLLGKVYGLMVMVAPEYLLPGNFQMGIVRDSVLVHPRKIQEFRLLTQVEDMSGSRSQYLDYYDTFITKNHGPAMQVSYRAAPNFG